MIDYATCQSQLRSTRLGANFILDPSFVCAGNKDNLILKILILFLK
jgi:hypothetical protein